MIQHSKPVKRAASRVVAHLTRNLCDMIADSPALRSQAEQAYNLEIQAQQARDSLTESLLRVVDSGRRSGVDFIAEVKHAYKPSKRVVPA